MTKPHSGAESYYPRKLGALLAERLRGAKEELVTRWLDRITARVTIAAADVFPSETLLNHVPLLIDGIAAYLEDPETNPGAENPVFPKAMELGALRHQQGFDAYEILKEMEILGAIIFSFLEEVADEGLIEGKRRDFLMCWQRIAYAIELIRQATMTHFLRLSADRVNEREERLRRFNRMVSHELKNRVGAIRGAAHLMGESWLSKEEVDRFHHMILENSEELHRMLGNLETLSRVDTDSRRNRNVLLPQATAEAVRQLRDLAQSKDIDVQISEKLPSVEVDAAAVELCLVNYISNAVKYADPAKDQRWVRIDGRLDPSGAAGGELIVTVSDNGLGVPENARRQLFDRFFRAHSDTVTGVEGSGLGLNIVRETAESLGGRAWADFPATGETVFAFALPSRRGEDAASAGTRRPEEKL
ncbi:MAG TPA: sensor histidine kinase [Gemmatimonadaceae bacterium]|nr:sensor histidine kinase [Gemmatimonadaceae bacterium]